MNQFQLDIEGMSCMHCVKTVKQALGTVPGLVVESVTVGKAVVVAPDAGSLERAVAAIEAEDFRVVGKASQ